MARPHLFFAGTTLSTFAKYFAQARVLSKEEKTIWREPYLRVQQAERLPIVQDGVLQVFQRKRSSASVSVMSPLTKDERKLFGYASLAVASLGLACITFAIGVWIATPPQIPWRQIVFSYLMSSTHNPQGHLYAASGLVLCTFFLVPVGGRLRYAFPRTWTMCLASILFIIGVGGLTFMGSLAFVSDNLGPFHDNVTAVSLFGVLSSMAFYLYEVSRRGRGKSRTIAAAMFLFLLGVIALLVYIFRDPDFINSAPATTVWHALAAWEWSVVTGIAIYLFLLLFLSSDRE